MIQKVNYVWRCRKCSAENAPSIALCAQCNYPAIAVGSKHHDESITHPVVPLSVFTRNPWVFLPEGLVALVIIVASPLWGIRMLFDGRWGASLMLLASTVTGVVLCWQGHRNNSVLAAWLGMIVVLAGALATHWL